MMLRRSLTAGLAALMLVAFANRAGAVTVRDVIELTKAGLGDSVLLALIDVERSVFAIDAATVKQLKDAGVSEAVIVAMIRSGRPPRTEEPAAAADPRPAAEPTVIVIDHQQPAPAPVAYPAPVPVYVPVAVPAYGTDIRSLRNTIETTLSTDQGIVKARVPIPANCVKAEPVFWGFGGKLRPGSWEPPPTVVCR